MTAAMLRRLARLRRDGRGVSTIEFALIAPVLITMIFGMWQMGRLFYAHAALRNAVAEGARFATIDPRPSSAAIIARINANRSPYGLSDYGTPTVTYAKDATTQEWSATISMNHRITLDFIFYSTAPITLSYQRTTWVQAP